MRHDAQSLSPSKENFVGLMPSSGPLTPIEAVSDFAFDREALRILLQSIIASELSRLQRRPIPTLEEITWTDSTHLGDDGIGFDSLSLIGLVGRLTRTFDLAQTGVEDYFLASPNLGQWVDLLSLHWERCLDKGDGPTIGFESSGSTGPATFTRHALFRLATELLGLIDVLGTPKRVIFLVPPHHIYGFLYGLFLPSILAAPRIDCRTSGPGTIFNTTRSGDLVVATPHIWASLTALKANFPHRTVGLTSGAPAPEPLWNELHGRGLEQLTEVYGSTETSGIGWRRAHSTGFCLMSHLQRKVDGVAWSTEPNASLALQDHLSWIDDRSFRPTGRRDRQIQVGGVNVSPQAVQRALESVPGVREILVRCNSDVSAPRLKAFIVPEPGAITNDIEAALRQRAGTMRPAERPQSFKFGDALPRNAIGKHTDWPDA